MREIRTSGSVEGAVGDHRSYSDNRNEDVAASRDLVIGQADPWIVNRGRPNVRAV